jgi:CHC2 zinc finger
LNKPDIIEVIGARVELRKAGREYCGLAPCHDDRRPSLRVNAEKQVWFCDPCARGGDVIDFVMLADRVSFPEALRTLGMDATARPPVPKPSPNRTAGGLLADWLNRQFLLFGARCRRLSRQIAIADDPELLESIIRDWEILSDIHGDLANPELAAELWEARESIEALTADVELEPPDPLPRLTEAYRAYLRSLVTC